MKESNTPQGLDLMAALRAASKKPGPARDPLFDFALNDPSEVFEQKFERAVKSHTGFSARMPK